MRKSKRSKLKTRNRILLMSAIFITAFIVYTLAFYSIKGWQWDAIFPFVLGVGGVVDVMTAVVAIADKMSEKTKKTKGE